MRFIDINGRRYAQFERLARQPGLAHAFATRPMDVSMRGDVAATQREVRRRQMAADLGLDPGELHCCVQIHQSALALIDAHSPPGRVEDTDAICTNLPRVPLMTFSADCPLVLVYDPRRPAIGMAHASWRCTVARAAASLVAALVRRYGSDPSTLLAGIGPSAGPCCYEVQRDVHDAAAGLECDSEGGTPENPADSPRPAGRRSDSLRERLFPTRGGRMYFDLWEANRVQLVAAGLREANIELAGVCTMCRTDLFYSFRQEGAGCGHFGLIAALTPPVPPAAPARPARA